MEKAECCCCCCCREQECCEKESKCGYEKEENLVECLERGWQKSSLKAWEDVLKEILKEKIRQKYGAELDKGAQAFVDAMDKSWKAKVTAAKAQHEFKEAILKALFNTGQ